MEKIKFTLDTGESVEFYILEQTKLGGKQYILVAWRSPYIEGDKRAGKRGKHL